MSFYRIGMGPISDLKDEWLEVYKTQAEYYDDNEDDDLVPYAMWVVMRSDTTVNPPTVLHGERTEDGWDVEMNDKPPEKVKQERKEEILRDIDGRGFIEPVLQED